MTQLFRDPFPISGVRMNGESTLPSIADMRNVQQQITAILSEDDNVYLKYGFVDGCFPYRMQDMYSREMVPLIFDSVVLENEYLKARFIPELGGRLWSLFDKVAGRELTFENPVFRPGNLAIRNAWFSGGIEWNFGMVGHHPFTCSPVFAAKLTASDGTPVLRIYEFERVRACTYQVDFFLPEDSRVLFCRTRIVNPTHDTVPVYWWSNMAVPEWEKGRVVVGGTDTYTSRRGLVSKSPIPICDEGFDCTYPVNTSYAVDYFWRTTPGNRRYVCHLGEDGYGLVQTSTEKMLGRKLFVWGQGQGGDNWQEFLSGNDSAGRYVEIQAGLAQTQYECVPMPPNTAWEWLEAYGAMNADAKRVHGAWTDAQQAVEQGLEQMISRQRMEQILAETKEDIALKPAEEILLSGSGWGALENVRRSKSGLPPLSQHLDFGEIGTEQAGWLTLLETGRLPAPQVGEAPASYMLQTQWSHMLEKALTGADAYNWYTWYQLGLVRYVQCDFEKARMMFERSLSLSRNAFNQYAMAQLLVRGGDFCAAASFAAAALECRPEDASLAKECLSILLKAGQYEQVIRHTASLPQDIGQLGRIQLTHALAQLERGNIEQAQEILHQNGGLIVPDIREGENSVTDLWFRIEQANAERDGKVFNPVDAVPPRQLDFRMM